MEIWNLRTLQEEQAPWSKKNFGDRPSWQPLLGLVEEVGELDEALEAKDEAEIRDAIADITIYMADFCTALGFDLEALHARSLQSIMLPVKNLRIVAKLAHAYLKQAQGIRGTAFEHNTAMQEQLVTLLWNLNVLCGMLGDPLQKITFKVWQKVKARDWTKNAKTGEAPAT